VNADPPEAQRGWQGKPALPKFLGQSTRGRPAACSVQVFGMYHGFPRRLMRMTRRMMLPDRATRRALRQAANLVPTSLFDPLRPATAFAAGAAGSIVEIGGFGANPGRLRMLLHVPSPAPRPGAPLLVLLHGCGQDARGFAASSGFMALADRLGAPLLLPDQQIENNQHRCFNWFRPTDIRRGSGEVASIRQMVGEVLRRFEADPGRVFVAGLSAGGALAAALLAAYPDVFAGGGVVAGLPVGAAHDPHQALLQMSRPERAPREVWVARLPERRQTRWPRLSVWHGEADRTVDPANADLLVAQWTGRLGLTEAPDAEFRPAPGLRRRVWGDAVEQWSVAGFGHGFPVAEGQPTDPFVLPAGIAAAEAMARFWGLAAA
jgi:poly(hydroxyalkanoate) depolymerase family esterase